MVFSGSLNDLDWPCLNKTLTNKQSAQILHMYLGFAEFVRQWRVLLLVSKQTAMPHLFPSDAEEGSDFKSGRGNLLSSLFKQSGTTLNEQDTNLFTVSFFRWMDI